MLARRLEGTSHAGGISIRENEQRFFPGTRILIKTIAQKLKARGNFTVNIRPYLSIAIERVSYYDYFKGHAIVVQGPDASYICHSVDHAARETSRILRSYDRLVGEKNLRDRMRVFDTTGED